LWHRKLGAEASDRWRERVETDIRTSVLTVEFRQKNGGRKIKPHRGRGRRGRGANEMAMADNCSVAAKVQTRPSSTTEARCSTERRTATKDLHTRIARIVTNFTEGNKGNEERANDRIMQKQNNGFINCQRISSQVGNNGGKKIKQLNRKKADGCPEYIPLRRTEVSEGKETG